MELQGARPKRRTVELVVGVLAHGAGAGHDDVRLRDVDSAAEYARLTKAFKPNL